MSETTPAAPAATPAPENTEAQIPKWLLVLGGKKMIAMLAGLVGTVVVALLTAAGNKWGFALPEQLAQVITEKIAWIVSLLIGGQSVVDSITKGATSTYVAAKSSAQAAKELSK